jgi:Tfp pilus assembly protein PilF
MRIILACLAVLLPLALGACAQDTARAGRPGAAPAATDEFTRQMGLGVGAIQRRDYAAAVQHADAAIAAAPSTKARARALTLRGLAHTGGKNDAAAMADFTAAIAADPQFSIAYYWRGTVKHDARDFAGAASDFRTAAAYDGRPDYYRAYMRAQIELRNFREAQAGADQLVRIEPGQANNWVVRGIIHEIQGNLANAASDYRSALSIEPHNVQAREGMARMRARAAGGGRGPAPVPVLPPARGPRVLDL